MRAFASHGARIAIGSERPGWVERLSELLPGAAPIPPTSLDVTYSVVERDGATLHLLADGELIARSDDPETLAALFEADLHFRIATAARDLVFVHAGAVALGGRVIVVPGPSRAGKSTLVAALVEAGATYFSDEYAPFDARGGVHPYPRRIRLRPRTGDGRYGRSVPVPGNRTGREPLPLGLIVAPVYAPGATWEPAGLSAGEAILTLFENTLLARERPREALAAFREAVVGVPAVRGVRDEADEVVRWIVARAEEWAEPQQRPAGLAGSGERLARPA